MGVISDYIAEAFYYETITVTSATVGLSAIAFSRQGRPVSRAVIQVNSGGNINFRIDGGVATSVDGFVLRQFDNVVIRSEKEIRNFNTRSVTSATNGVIAVTYFG